MTKKDERGRVSPFLYSSDDPSVKDYYSKEQVFDRRVFISFERSSLEIAKKFEASLKACGLEPWRYEPAEAITATDGEYTLRTVKEQYPETVSKLVASVRRCPAVLFIISEKTRSSALCELEAFATSIIHSFWPDNRIRNEAGVFIVLEGPDVLPPVTLEKYWSRVYEHDLEWALAEIISNEMARLAEILTVVEAHRARIYRQG